MTMNIRNMGALGVYVAWSSVAPFSHQRAPSSLPQPLLSVTFSSAILMNSICNHQVPSTKAFHKRLIMTHPTYFLTRNCHQPQRFMRHCFESCPWRAFWVSQTSIASSVLTTLIQYGPSSITVRAAPFTHIPEDLDPGLFFMITYCPSPIRVLDAMPKFVHHGPAQKCLSAEKIPCDSTNWRSILNALYLHNPILLWVLPKKSPDIDPNTLYMFSSLVLLCVINTSVINKSGRFIVENLPDCQFCLVCHLAHSPSHLSIGCVCLIDWIAICISILGTYSLQMSFCSCKWRDLTRAILKCPHVQMASQKVLEIPHSLVMATDLI